MILSGLVGMILISLIVWALLIIVGRLRNPKYSNLYVKFKKEKGIGESDQFERFWKPRDALERPGVSRDFTLEETYLYYYRHAMNYLSIALSSIIILAVVYYLPALISYVEVNNIPSALISVRKYAQILFVVLTFFGFFAYHRCHYQIEVMYKGLNQSVT